MRYVGRYSEKNASRTLKAERWINNAQMHILLSKRNIKIVLKSLKYNKTNVLRKND